MTDREIMLRPAPLTPEAFMPYGDVIAAGVSAPAAMNSERFERFDDLAGLDVDGSIGIGIARCRIADSLPRRCSSVERHPLGSQAFIPLGRFHFIVVVARPGDPPSADDLRAFVTDGSQGVNYRRGTWHVPLIGLAAGQEFLIVDRRDARANCETHQLATPVVLLAPLPDEGSS